jgi:dsDNA-specific endonuclease/ATPase MutS2
MTDHSRPPFEKSDSGDLRSEDPAGDSPTASDSYEFPGEGGDSVEFPITDVLDLHTVSPRDAEAVVEEYLHECYRLKLTAIRIIHGRGIGAQRAMVRKVLERTAFVVFFEDAPLEAGGWGATVITLRRPSPA